MDPPAPVADRLEGESVETRVALGGGDAVYCTPSRTLVYRSDGLLSDESVDVFDLAVDRVTLDEGRRKTTIRLSDVEGTREFTVPKGRTNDVLAGVLAGVLRTAGDIEAEEDVLSVHRFSELTLVLTEARLLKHVGGDVWGPDSEAFPFADATDISAEEGTHAMLLVLEIDGRPERIKLPAEEAGAVRREIERALFAHHGVDSRAAFRAAVGTDADEAPATDEPANLTDESVPAIDFDADAEREDDADLDRRLAALEETVAQQTDLLERQEELLDQLVEELRRGR